MIANKKKKLLLHAKVVKLKARLTTKLPVAVAVAWTCAAFKY